ncbi:hypothetical protein K503DRAFT_478790 [Rhizopogon vinicolor AM-OR11-026]|uniref:Uncharacterized protein n=1 Tax=Rhizopogon vinicolor AM-OR11-026 TaxID=1314800 RepID=A0A1B7MN30_9AGAM|nr:hypothetical protein K503DRAFT_478790 [Rhizopogon vinicolor AM-OR11-026]
MQMLRKRTTDTLTNLSLIPHPHPRQLTYDNSDATAPPFPDTNRPSTTPTNVSTIWISTARPTVNRLLQQTQAPTAHQHILPHPQLALVTLPQDQVWTLMAHSRTLPPSGFGGVSMTFAPPPSDPAVPRVSRTMQYADAYAAVWASLATSPVASPTCEPYTGYR